jgi:hypothetical protein
MIYVQWELLTASQNKAQIKINTKMLAFWVPIYIRVYMCVYIVKILVNLYWMIRFIATLYTALGSTGNYSAIANLRTLELTAVNTLGFSVFSLH